MTETVEALEQRLLGIDAAIEALQGRIAPLQKEIVPLQRDLSALQEDAASVRARLSTARKAPRVSDHAVIRYLERKYGFDFEDVREEILTPKMIDAINSGANAFKVNNAKFIVKDKTVVTCHG